MILYFLPMILFLGIITSYEDIKEGKIRNKWVVIALLYSLFANLGLIAYYYYYSSVEYSYTTDLLANFGIALVVSFIAWNYKVWSAGDAKLFLAYAALVPLSVYSYGYTNYFPSLVILVNTFVPFTIYLLFKMIFQTSTKEKLNVLKEVKAKDILIMVVSLFSIQWLVGSVSKILGVKGVFTIYILVFGFYFALRKIINGKKFVYLMLLVALVRVVADKTIREAVFWYQLVGFALLFRVVMLLINATTKVLFSKEVSVESLKKGMLLTQGIKKEEHGNYKKLKDLKGSDIGLEPDGLTDEEIKWVKKNKKKFDFKTIKIQETIPFAPILFAGAILTLLSRGNFVFFVVKFITSIRFSIP